jgi:hypothetical protein
MRTRQCAVVPTIACKSRSCAVLGACALACWPSEPSGNYEREPSHQPVTCARPVSPLLSGS